MKRIEDILGVKATIQTNENHSLLPVIITHIVFDDDTDSGHFALLREDVVNMMEAASTMLEEIDSIEPPAADPDKGELMRHVTELNQEIVDLKQRLKNWEGK